MGRFTALVIFLLILLFVGGFLPAFLSPFMDISNPDKSSSVYIPISVIKFVGIDYNPVFLLLPSSFKTYMINALYSFTFLPDYISIPLLIIMFCCLMYVIITLVPTVGG